jgi:hypothetical protein
MKYHQVPHDHWDEYILKKDKKKSVEYMSIRLNTVDFIHRTIVLSWLKDMSLPPAVEFFLPGIGPLSASAVIRFPVFDY